MSRVAPVDAGEHPVLDGRPGRADLDRHGAAVLLDEVELATWRPSAPGGRAALQRSRAGGSSRPGRRPREVRADQLVRGKPIIVSIVSDRNVKMPWSSVEKTASGDVLDEEAVALLGVAELALEALPLGDVAGAPWIPAKTPSRRTPPGADLERQEPAVGVAQHQRFVSSMDAGRLALDGARTGAPAAASSSAYSMKVCEVPADELVRLEAERAAGRSSETYVKRPLGRSRR